MFRLNLEKLLFFIVKGFAWLLEFIVYIKRKLNLDYKKNITQTKS